MRIDLHAHTHHSDGTLSPAELVRLAWQKGLGALAVTDHDTTDGLAEAHRVGARIGVEIIDGCEVTCRIPSGVVHVLAYGFEVGHAGFQGLLTRVREGREARNAGIIERFRTLGIDLPYEDVTCHADGEIVARPHFAHALVEAGHAEDLRQAFDLYLKDGGAAYVQAEAPSAEETVAAIAAAGGAAVVAHPRSLHLGSMRAYRALFAGLKEHGLAGIEVAHPSHDADRRRMYASLASELDLVATAGSDFHGANKPYLELGTGDGTIEVDYAVWDALRARRGRAA